MPKTKKKILSERKKPRQERSRETVELILSTAEKLLEEKGYEHFSTNAVAKRTGVSIGTLYQYYPNKEALIAAIIIRRSERELGLLRDTLEEFKGRDFETILREIGRRHLTFHRERPDLQRLIVEEIPKSGAFPQLREMEATAIRSFARFLSNNREHMQARDPEVAAFLIFYGFKWIARTVVMVRPEFLNDKSFESELVALFSSYLVGKRL